MSTTVNCNQGQKINVALSAGFEDIKVRGTCLEKVEVRADDVTLQGIGNATIIGRIVINGANRATIKSLTVRGTPGNPTDSAVLIDRGGAAVLDRVTVREAVTGVDVTGNSYAEILNGSLFENNTGEGIRVQTGSGVIVKDSTSRSNGDGGITVTRGGSAQLLNSVFVQNAGFQVFASENSDAVLIGNTLTGFGEDQGLGVFRGSAVRLLGGNVITSVESFSNIHIDLASTVIQASGHDTVNGRLFVHDNSSAEFRDVEINADVDLDVSGHSILVLTERPAGSTNTTLNGGVGLSTDSALFVDDQVAITGTVFCADDESSFDPPDPGVVGGGIECTGF